MKMNIISADPRSSISEKTGCIFSYTHWIFHFESVAKNNLQNFFALFPNYAENISYTKVNKKTKFIPFSL